MANAELQPDGLHITLASGETIITNEQLLKDVYLGQNNLLLIRDTINKDLIYAFDSETKTVILMDLKIITDQEKLILTPEIDGYTLSNISPNKNWLAVYHNDGTGEGKVFDLTTGKELSLPEAGITELDLTDGTKWEMQLFTDSQEVLEYVAENTDWFKSDDVINDWGKLGMKEKLSDMLNKFKSTNDIKLSSFNGIFPSTAEREGFFFVIEMCEVTGKDGVIVSFLTDQDGGYTTVFLDDPNIPDSTGALIQEIKQKFIVK